MSCLATARCRWLRWEKSSACRVCPMVYTLATTMKPRMAARAMSRLTTKLSMLLASSCCSVAVELATMKGGLRLGEARPVMGAGVVWRPSAFITINTISARAST